MFDGLGDGFGLGESFADGLAAIGGGVDSFADGLAAIGDGVDSLFQEEELELDDADEQLEELEEEPLQERVLRRHTAPPKLSAAIPEDTASVLPQMQQEQDDAEKSPAAEILFARLVEKLQEDGAFISPKIKHSAVPLSNVPGLVANETLRKPEVLIHIPARLQLTAATAASMAPSALTAPLKHLSKAEGKGSKGEGKQKGKVGGKDVSHAEGMEIEGNGKQKGKVGGKDFPKGGGDGRGKEDSLAFRLECPELVVFVAWWLPRVNTRGACRADRQDGWFDAGWVDYLIGMQLSQSFDFMPHQRLVNDGSARQALEPSPELHNADWYQKAYSDAQAAIIKSIPKEILGTDFTPTDVVKAHLMLLTRTFGKLDSYERGMEHCFVPVADMLNHSPTPNALWQIDKHGDFLVTAGKRIAEGEEILISYGRGKSNVRLFRNYGFTLEPFREPSWSFRVWPKLAWEIFTFFFPEAERCNVIDLEAHRVDKSLRTALRAVAVHGNGIPHNFLRALCVDFQAMYEMDTALQEALFRLRSVRVKNPKSSVWWREHEDEDAHGDLDDDAYFSLCCLRVKMSEYLCLVTHLEALDLLSVEAELDARSCLPAAVELSKSLAEALEEADVAAAMAKEACWRKLIVPAAVKNMGWVPADMAPARMPIAEVIPGSWAEGMDLQVGDELVMVSSNPVPELNDRLVKRLMRSRPLDLLFYRHTDEHRKIPRIPASFTGRRGKGMAQHSRRSDTALLSEPVPSDSGSAGAVVVPAIRDDKVADHYEDELAEAVPEDVHVEGIEEGNGEDIKDNKQGLEEVYEDELQYEEGTVEGYEEESFEEEEEELENEEEDYEQAYEEAYEEEEEDLQYNSIEEQQTIRRSHASVEG